MQESVLKYYTATTKVVKGDRLFIILREFENGSDTASEVDPTNYTGKVYDGHGGRMDLVLHGVNEDNTALMVELPSSVSLLLRAGERQFDIYNTHTMRTIIQGIFYVEESVTNGGQ